METKKGSLNVQLDKLWDDEKDVLPLSTRGNKYVIISDMHMGNGEKADDFKNNEDAVVRAFNHYQNEGYSLILLGDVEELWQFTAEEVADRYNDSVYEAIRAFGDDRVYRVFGNHDFDWKTKDPIRTRSSLVYPVYEGIKLKDTNGIPKILLIHGHQGTKDSDENSFSSRAFVMLYRYIEPHVKVDEAIAAPRSVITQEFEKERFNWAKKNNVILICGHTHRAVFKSESTLDILKRKRDDLQDQLVLSNADPMSSERIELTSRIDRLNKEIQYETRLGREFKSLGRDPAPHYFNTGCALYTDGLTVIEIASNKIKLVKWHRKVRNGDMFSIYREERLSDILDRLK